MYITRTNSTNSLMKDLLARGEWRANEHYLYAGFQTAGRGQTGNGWESEEGKNLLCSILLPPLKTLFELNTAVSVAVHRTIGALGINELTIKWPNDIYWRDKKVAGILVESAIIGGEIKHVIAGIGLNVNQTEWHSDAPNPFSLKQISGQDYPIDDLMHSLYAEVRQALTEDVLPYYKTHLYRREGFWPFVERTVSTAPTTNADKGTEGIFLAKIEDVKTDGRIELRDQDGNLRIYHFKEVRYVI